MPRTSTRKANTPPRHVLLRVHRKHSRHKAAARRSHYYPSDSLKSRRTAGKARTKNKKCTGRQRGSGQEDSGGRGPPCTMSYVLPQTGGTCWVAAMLTAGLSSRYIRELINKTIAESEEGRVAWESKPAQLRELYCPCTTMEP